MREVTEGWPVGTPIGLGFRVPLLIVSPWSKGGYVYSEVSDHTSTLKFLESRFGIDVSPISPWRRAITADLTSAFNFTHPDYTIPEFPETIFDIITSFIECEMNPPPVVPLEQHMPSQEEGTRKSRALPYVFDAFVQNLNETNFAMNITNSGSGGAPFLFYNLKYPDLKPKKYAVEAFKSLFEDDLLFDSAGEFSYSLHGPNGYVRVFTGSFNSTFSANVRMEQTSDNNRDGIIRVNLDILTRND